jgi:DNA-binding transcriptional LysR family regulator
LAVVAAPPYLAERGEPLTPEDLARHDCFSYGHTTMLQRWPLGQGNEARTVPINAVLCSNNGDVLRAAALAGRGIALLPTFIVGPDIRAGRLRRILERFRPGDSGIYALYAPNRYLAAKTRVFIDFLASNLGGTPEWDRL